MGFHDDTPLTVTWLDPKRWQVQADVKYCGNADQFTVPKGYVTDFATVPWWSRMLTPSVGKWTRAAVIHDLLCTGLNEWHQVYCFWLDECDDDRELVDVMVAKLGGLHTAEGRFIPIPLADSHETDSIFRRIMREEDVDPLRRWVMWTGVRWGALANPARREGWLKDSPKVLGITLLLLAVLFLVAAGAHDFIDVFLEGDPL